MRIAVIGTGALGCLLAATLQPGHEVVMVGRWQAQLDAIAAGGLTLIAPDGRRSRHVLPATADPASWGDTADVALIAVKSRQTAQAAIDAATLLVPGAGLAVTLQNGLGNLVVLADRLGPDRVTAAVTAQGATLDGPAIVRHAGHGPTTIGLPDELNPRAADLVRQLGAAFRSAGWACEISSDVDGLVWRKLAINAAINPLTAVLGVANGALPADPALAAVMDAAAREVAAVARAQGVTLDAETAVALARGVARDTAANTSSMLRDVQRGVPTEIDAICGAVVAAAAQAGLEAPLNTALQDLVRQREAANGPLDRSAVLQTLARAAQQIPSPAEVQP